VDKTNSIKYDPRKLKKQKTNIFSDKLSTEICFQQKNPTIETDTEDYIHPTYSPIYIGKTSRSQQ